jgi:hypothetical protein
MPEKGAIHAAKVLYKILGPSTASADFNTYALHYFLSYNTADGCNTPILQAAEQVPRLSASRTFNVSQGYMHSIRGTA